MNEGYNGASRSALREANMKINAWLTGIFVMLPVGFVWWRLAGNALTGQESTFSIVKDNAGKWVASPELTPLIFPAAYLVLMHLVRFFTVLLTFQPDKTVEEPSQSSFNIEYDSKWILMFFGGTYLFWAVNMQHTEKQQHWPFLSFLVFALASYAMVLRRWVYGFKLADSQVKVQAGGREEPAEALSVARVSVPTVRFSDIYGNNETKRRLLAAASAVIAPRRQGEQVRNGILMDGEPGNGKTVMAEALAGELGLPFLQLTHGDVASQWVGERSVRIKAAFEQAIRNQPCMLFIDEIDSFIPSRDSANSSRVKEDEDVVNLLLTLLVDIRKASVVVVAATNYIDRLDAASVREGRFDFKVEITPPDEEARVGLLRHGLSTNAPKLKVADEVVLNVAKRWNGFSVKRILAVTEEIPAYVADLAEKDDKKGSLAFEDFMAVLRRIQGRKGVSPENVKSLDELVLPAATREAITMLASRLRDPMRVERLGGSLPSGLLFHGPSGTGKTETCKALAKEVGWAFLVSTGSDLNRDPKALEKLYSQAKELRPAIIFIDEADDLLRSRAYSPNTEATNKLLTLMDGTRDRVRDVIWVAATNNPDQIDEALLRGGRFTEKIEFVRPNESQLAVHIAGWLAKRKIQLNAGLSPASIAGSLGDESIANADAVMQYAVNRRISLSDGEVVCLAEDDLKSALTVVLGVSA